MRLNPFSAMLFALGALSTVVQPGLAQTSSVPTDQVIPAGDTTYRGRFTIDPVTGAVNGIGKVEWNNGNRYEGSVRNTQLTGKGKFAWSNGDRYEGDMVNAEPHGQGTYYFKGGDRYSGAWNNGQKHGQGRYTFVDGSYWEGLYANDRQLNGAMGNLGGSVAEVQRTVAPSTQQLPIATKEALPIVVAEPKRESVQPTKAGGGDPNKYSTTPGNPSCRFFDGFADNGDGTVTDPRTQLVWKRCAEGQAWNGTACTGQSTEMNWYEAMQAAKDSRFLGKNDWRLPSKDELSTVVGDYEGGCKSNRAAKGQYAVSGTLGKKDGSSFSYSPSNDHINVAWSVEFSAGYLGGRCRDCSDTVRLVRASQSSPGAAGWAAFNAEYKKIEVYKAEDKRQAKREAARDAAFSEAAAREKRERAQIERRQEQQWSVLGRTVDKYGMAGHRQETITISCSSQKLRTVYRYVTGDWANETPYEDIYSNRRFSTLEQAAANSCRQ